MSNRIDLTPEHVAEFCAHQRLRMRASEAKGHQSTAILHADIEWMLAAAEERDRLRAELQQCKKVSQERFAYCCRLEAVEEELDVEVEKLRAQRDALVAAGDGHRVYLDQWEAAVSAVEEATDGQ